MYTCLPLGYPVTGLVKLITLLGAPMKHLDVLLNALPGENDELYVAEYAVA